MQAVQLWQAPPPPFGARAGRTSHRLPAEDQRGSVDWVHLFIGAGLGHDQQWHALVEAQRVAFLGGRHPGGAVTSPCTRTEVTSRQCLERRPTRRTCRRFLQHVGRW